MKDLLESNIRQIEQAIPFTTCALLLYDTQTELITVEYAAGQYATKLVGRTVRPGVGIAGWVAVNNRAAFSVEPNLDFIAFGVEPDPFYLSALSIPLEFNGRTLGALALYSSKATCYDAEDHLLLQATAARLAGELGAVLEGRSTASFVPSDHLDHRPVYSTLESYFAFETARARRFGTRLTLLSLDLANFHMIIERFGNRAAEQFMAEALLCLREKLAESDFIVCRDDGRFVVLQQSGNSSDTQPLFEALGDSIDDLIYRRFDQLSFAVTLNMAAAECGRDGQTLAELLCLADRAILLKQVTQRVPGAPIVKISDYRRG